MENDTFRRYLALLMLDTALVKRHRDDPVATMQAAGLTEEEQTLVTDDSISDLLSHLDEDDKPFPPDEPPDTGD